MIVHPHQTEHHNLLGGKAKALAELSGTGFNIPPWFAVTGDDTSLRDEITRCARGLGANRFAVRSSARGEDGADHSFAGQYDTFLHVEFPQLHEKIRQVRQSNRSDRLDTYQSSKKIQLAHRPAAIVQAMLNPEVSGVAFSADPVTGKRDHAIVSALWGVGSALVSGEADADTWTVGTDGHIIKRNITSKTKQHTRSPGTAEGVAPADVPSHMQDTPCLDDAQVAAISNMARECANHFGCPQDIEWAIEGGTLYLLQSRPITTLTHTPDPDAPLTVWDNSNIAESYSGITSPMTFSFAERAYEHVYREFCKLLSVPESRIRENDAVFSQMLGHIRGHVYYNLNSWHHVLAMLPGFSINRSFMEQMMGVKQPMPGEIVQRILKQTRTSKTKDTWALIRTLAGLIKSHRRLPGQIKAFYARLDDALNPPGKPLTKMNGTELTAHYAELETRLLKRWDAPLVNDFLAMIFYGVLKSLCEKWLGDASLQNTLLLDSGDIISAEPPRRIKAMAAQAAQHDSLARLLADPETSPDQKLTELRQHPTIYRAYQEYLEDFGDRCLEELKLESPTVGDNPQSLLTGIGVMAVRASKQDDTRPATQKTPQKNHPAKQLRGLKRRIFNWVLENARDRVRDRENLRFERTRLFGRVRQIIVELGKRLHQDQRLDNPDDVFFLTIAEVMQAYRSPFSQTKFQPLCRQRREEQNTFTTPPPDRFETRGSLEHYKEFTPATPEEPHHGGKKLHGTGACPGIVRGTVRVVTDPRNATLREGEILVAQQTDPGWVVLFPAASGLLVERGSLLSHSAIVARELKLPCIVSISKVTTLLKTGDTVEMNGSTGKVTITPNNSTTE